MTNTILDVRNLSVEFTSDDKRILAVNNISFQLKRGQTLGIVGESGSGKSVTSLAVMGLIPPPAKVTGEIYFTSKSAKPDDKPIDLLTIKDREKQSYRGGKIAMIFQEPMSSLNPVYPIGFQLTEAILQHQNLSSQQAIWKASELLQQVQLLPNDQKIIEQFKQRFRNKSEIEPPQKEIDDYINQQKRSFLSRYPHQLSGGQLQRVMIAMAISCEPDILIADEPTTALDVTVQAEILKLLRQLRDDLNMSLIFISHDLGVIAEIADTVAVMYRGEIRENKNVLQIFSHPEDPYTKALLACRPSLETHQERLPIVSDFMKMDKDGKIVEIKERADHPNQKLQVISENPKSLTPNSQSPEILLSVSNLQVEFPNKGMFGIKKGYTMAVNKVSFNVFRGETLGLVGESGCGKSTLARTLLGLIKPKIGEIKFNNSDITHFQGEKLRQLRREMQIIFQNPFSSLDPRIKIGDAVMEPLVIHGWGKNERERRDRAAEMLEKVRLDPDRMNRYPHEFSGGQRQRVCIARALALEPNPKLIICDESVSALDVSVQAEVLNLLKDLQLESKGNLTYIFISHDLSVVKFMSDRIMVMNRGKKEEIDEAERIYWEPQTDYTRQLIASIPTGTLDRIKQLQRQREDVGERGEGGEGEE